MQFGVETNSSSPVTCVLTVNGRELPVNEARQASYTFTETGWYTIVATVTDANGTVRSETLSLEVLSQNGHNPTPNPV
ncbi:MAG: hypothetical protein LUG50_16545 [Planctomycetaceae bacterium]|nr:hypothetical protein [Planctomycetaceae bacterium]